MQDINVNNLFYNYERIITDSKIYKPREGPSKKTDKHICIIKSDKKSKKSIIF